MPDIYQNYAGYRPPSVHIGVKELLRSQQERQVPLIIGQGLLLKALRLLSQKQGIRMAPFNDCHVTVAVGNRRNTESYIKGTDYQLSGVNQIEWLSDGNAPPTGATYYVYYKPDLRISRTVPYSYL